MKPTTTFRFRSMVTPRYLLWSILLGVLMLPIALGMIVLLLPSMASGNDGDEPPTALGDAVQDNHSAAAETVASAADNAVYLPLIVGDDSAPLAEIPTGDPIVELPPTDSEVNPDSDDFVARVVARTNVYRREAGCRALVASDQLAEAAQRHSDDMVSNNFVSHTGSDDSLPWDRIKDTGYRYTRAAENIAAGFTRPEVVVDRWMGSSRHRATILNCDLREIGVGYAFSRSSTYRHYWTQVFAAPDVDNSTTTTPVPPDEASPTPTVEPTDTPPDAPTATPESPDPGPSDFVAQVVELTNSHRREEGCPALIPDPQLTEAGQQHSDDMAENRFMSHTGSDGSSPWERIKDTGYRYSRAAENVAAGYRSPESVVNAWMRSSGHRKNILNCKLREIGVGHALNGSTHYWTQVFATPR